MLSNQHKLIGKLTIIGSIVLYTIGFFNALHYNNTHSGDTLPGLDSLALLILVAISLFFLLLQFIFLYFINKKSQVTILNLLIFAPALIYFCWLLHFYTNESPLHYKLCNYSVLLFGLIGSYLAIKKNKNILFYIFFSLSLLSILVEFQMNYLSTENSRWWDNGKEIKYAENGQKILEIERKKAGVIFGTKIEWDDNGKLTHFIRYPNGNNNKPDSIVKYYNGEIMTQKFLFDSNHVKYQKMFDYHFPKNNNWEATSDSLILLRYSLTNTSTKEYHNIEWSPITRKLQSDNFVFDSNGKKYQRHNTYNIKKENLFSVTTNTFDSVYFRGTQDDLY